MGAVSGHQNEENAESHGSASLARPSAAQAAWLARGVDQPGGKLPLFDEAGQRVDSRTIRACLEKGWAEPWFSNPLKPDWLVCKLTMAGREAIDAPVVENS